MILLLILTLFLAGCSTPEAPPLQATPQLLIDGLVTTAHSADGQHHLEMHADRAIRDDQLKEITSHNVHATFTHRNTHTISITSPCAQWQERTAILYSNGPVVLNHPAGTLRALGNATFTLATRRVHLAGPILHTVEL